MLITCDDVSIGHSIEGLANARVIASGLDNASNGNCGNTIGGAGGKGKCGRSDKIRCRDSGVDSINVCI